MTLHATIKAHLKARPMQWVYGLDLEKMDEAWKEKASIISRRTREFIPTHKTEHNVRILNPDHDPSIEMTKFPYVNAKGKKVNVVAYRYNPSKDPAHIPLRPPEPTKPAIQASFFSPVPEKPKQINWAR